MNKCHYCWLLIVSIFMACHKDGNVGPRPTNPGGNNRGGMPTETPSERVVYVINEGNFMGGNGSVTSYDPGSGQVSQHVFEQQNGFPLGDIPQSMAVVDGQGYIVVNNSQKVEIVDLENLSAKGTIQGFTSPRYLVAVSNTKAYVSDLYADAIAVVDLLERQIAKHIAVSGWTEQIVVTAGKAFVANVDRDLVLVFDTKVDTLLDSIPVSRSPVNMQLDANDKLWVLCNGGIEEDFPALEKISTDSLAVDISLRFPGKTTSPNRLVMNGSRDKLYFLNEGVYEMSVEATALPANAIIPEVDRIFYGLGLDPENNDIFVSDAGDYIQQGTVFIYRNKDLSLKSSFKTGIIPGDFYFHTREN